jgi:hypothetical protein
MAVVAATVLLGIRSLLTTFQADSEVEYSPAKAIVATLAYSLAAVVLSVAWWLRHNRGRGATKRTQNQRPPSQTLGHSL